MRNRLRLVGSGTDSAPRDQEEAAVTLKTMGAQGRLPSGDMGAEVGSLPSRAGHQDGHTIRAASAKGMVPHQGDDHPATSEDSPVRL